MTTNSTSRYIEKWSPPWAPLVFFLPCFYKYGIKIEKDYISFGYGFRGPGGWTSHRTALKDIDPKSIKTGTASGMDNLLQFGGWGIRLGLFNGIRWAYNACNGPYIEFKENGTLYRFVSKDVEKVVEILKGEVES